MGRWCCCGWVGGVVVGGWVVLLWVGGWCCCGWVGGVVVGRWCCG